MIFIELELAGCFLIQARSFQDYRGSFSKLFHKDLFREQGLAFELAEQLFSRSQRGVLRGMHFQIPPHDHAKLVSCLSGKILDVMLDLRRGSASYGQHLSVELTPAAEQHLFIPRGIAHGFLSLEDDSGVFYSTSKVHHRDSDAGVRWDSFGFNWPVAEPIVSERDAQHPPFATFDTPFT